MSSNSKKCLFPICKQPVSISVLYSQTDSLLPTRKDQRELYWGQVAFSLTKDAVLLSLPLLETYV